MKIILTRSAFCCSCEQAGRPKTNNIMVLHGSSGYHVHLIEYAAPHTHTLGFTPHIFELGKAVDGLVTGTKICSICGFDVQTNPKYESGQSNKPYLISILHKSPFKMKLADWNALVLNKDLGYKIDT